MQRAFKPSMKVSVVRFASLCCTMTTMMRYAATAFTTAPRARSPSPFLLHRLRASSTSTADVLREGVSRVDTLRALLSVCGAPGSVGCREPGLVPETTSDVDLHPHLLPIARNEATGHLVCALRRPSSPVEGPFPLVEAAVGSPGMRLLSLHSEHYMRRMAAEADDAGSPNAGEILTLYNEDLGTTESPLRQSDHQLDNPYEPGSVAKLGYGPEKYALLRIGPFPDLYENMARQHAARGDESSSLIAAETANGKFPGFGSTYVFYADLMSTFPNREAEVRDAARVCLRLPLPGAALDAEGLAALSRLADTADDGDDVASAVAGLRTFYEKVKALEKEQEGAGGPADDPGKTPEQAALDEADDVLNRAALSCADGVVRWSDARKEVACIYAEVGQEDMARFVDPDRV